VALPQTEQALGRGLQLPLTSRGLKVRQRTMHKETCLSAAYLPHVRGTKAGFLGLGLASCPEAKGVTE
jgi:IS5 family transposase